MAAGKIWIDSAPNMRIYNQCKSSFALLDV